MFSIGHNLDKTARGRANIAQMQYRPNGRLAGGRIHDLAALGKAIVLTESEAKKFNAKAVGYSTNPSMPRVAGYSDASGEFCQQAILFLKKD